MAEKDLSKFNWIESHSLEVAVEVKIISLQGNQLKPKYESLLKDPSLKFSGLYQSPCADLLVECQVFSNGSPISLPVHTSYKAFTTRWNWSEWIDLGIYYSVLPRDAKLAVTIYDCAGPTEMRAVGGTTISLFKKLGLFREGTIDLQVWLNQKADGSLTDTTPGKPRKDGGRMHQLAKLTKKYRNGEMKVVEWMDRLSFREIEKINERERANSEFMYLTIEFGQIVLKNEVYNVVYYEQGDDVIPFKTQNEIVKFPDPEIGLENLVEKKHHILSRSARSKISDKDAKPNAVIRDTLISIVNYPPTKQLASEEQDLMWKFRFYLSNQKKACVKFLECVNWKLPEEAKQALDLLAQWAPMGVEDALRLLSPRFQHASVRKYAVARLQLASDEDLLLYLLQLVQALKYENFKDINTRLKHLNELMHSKDDVVSLSGEEKSIKENADVTNYLTSILTSNGEQDLAMFLIDRACRNFSLANYFYWYLMVECEDCELGKQDNAIKNMYLTVMNTFLVALQYANAESQKKYAHLKRQRTLIDKLVQLVKGVARENANRKKKIEYFQSSLKDVDTFKFNFANFEPLPFPLDPNVLIKGVIAEKATLFNSKLMPSKLTFVTTEYTEYVVIFRHGDDLRQDQLVLQIITLMDKLLRRENLDLKLTPYRVLAISSKHGFVQFVDSVPVAEVLTTDGSIQNFFKKHHPSESGLYGIASDIMDTYVKSCAGYCVITYLLGIGDRHFDNLLLTTTGKLFHIDFGYILGRDPKPLPPPMKLSREMVEAMGGMQSEHYAEFRKLCYTAFLHLRRHSNLILNLFALMADASVPDIALEPDKAVIKVQDKFRLDLGDEEAVRHFQTLMDQSITAVMTPIVEQLHKIAQYWRT